MQSGQGDPQFQLVPSQVVENIQGSGSVWAKYKYGIREKWSLLDGKRSTPMLKRLIGRPESVGFGHPLFLKNKLEKIYETPVFHGEDPPRDLRHTRTVVLSCAMGDGISPATECGKYQVAVAARSHV